MLMIDTLGTRTKLILTNYSKPDYCQTPVLGLGLGVDFVLPLSQQEQEQQEQEQQEQEEPHQNRPLPGMLGR